MLAQYHTHYGTISSRIKHKKPPAPFSGKCNEDEKKLSMFIEVYLERDGVFLLQLTGANTDDITVAELAYSLFGMLTRLTKKVGC